VIRDTGAAVELLIRVVPRAQKTALAGERDGHLLIRLAAPPVDGAANAALVAYLSELLDVPKRQITIISGEQSRSKRIAIAGVRIDDVKAQLLPGREVR
jgi:uncharacterized protein (TIGR00251 family)